MVTYTENFEENLIGIFFFNFYHDILWIYITVIKQ
jgi:hypothetical protein